MESEDVSLQNTLLARYRLVHPMYFRSSYVKFIPRENQILLDEEIGSMPTNNILNRKLRMALVGGGQGAFIGRVHCIAAI